jgi:hypothetical protein
MGRPPIQLDANQVYKAINGTCRGGRWKPRPGWFNHPLIFASQDVQTAFQNGFFQDGSFFDLGGYSGDNALGPQAACLLSSHSGRQFRINLQPTMGTTAITANVNPINPGQSATVSVLTSWNMSLSWPNITIGGSALTLTAIDPSGISITVRNDGSIATQTIIAGSTVAFPPLQNYMVDEITPTKANVLGSITTGPQTKTTAQFTMPAVGDSVQISVASSANFSLLYAGLTVGGLPMTLTAIDPSGVLMTVRNDTASNVTVPPVSFGVGTPVLSPQTFTIPAVGTPANLVLSDASSITLQHPQIVLGGNTLSTVTATTSVAQFTIPPLNQSITLPVSSTTGMDLGLPDIGILMGTVLTQDVTFPSATGVPFVIPLASTAGMSLDQPGVIISPGYPVTLLNLGTGTTTTPGVTFPGTVGTSFNVNVASTLGMDPVNHPNISLGLLPVTLISINSGTQITVQNSALANVGATVGASNVTFALAANCVLVMNNVSAWEGITAYSSQPVRFYTPLLLTAFNATQNTIEVQNLTPGSAGLVIGQNSIPYVDFMTASYGNMVTTNVSYIVIPPVGTLFSIPVSNASQIPYTLIGKKIVVGGYQLVLKSIDGFNQISVISMVSGNYNKHILNNSGVVFQIAGSSQVTPTLGFSVPAVNTSVDVLVANASNLSVTNTPSILINGFPFTLTGIAGNLLTVVNWSGDNVGAWIPVGSPVTWTMPSYTLTVTQIIDAVTVVVENNVGSPVPGTVIPAQTYVTVETLDANNPNISLNWSIQAQNWWLLQDNQSRCIIFDGSKALRSDPSKNQVPDGNVMCYAQGRLMVALTDRLSYMVGDLIGGPSGTANNGYFDSILYFTETLYLDEGGNITAKVFGAPSDSGPILAMKACAQTDTQLGQGSVLVGSHNVVFTVNLPFDRTVWATMQNPLQTANPIKGPTGQRSTIAINTDMYYRSLDGDRTYLFAQRQFNSQPGNTTISNEVDSILKYDTQSLLEFGCQVEFDNRKLETVSPIKSPNGVWHQGLTVMDFNLNDGLRKRFGQAWEGIWTGLRILKLVTGIVNGEERCFIYALNDSSQIELWELSKKNESDGDWNGSMSPTPINWVVESRGMACRNLDQFKKLKYGHINAPVVSGLINITVGYKSDEWPCWQPWTQVSRCAKTSDCGPWTNCFPTAYLPQPRTPIRLPDAPDYPNPVTNKTYRLGYQFQLRVQMTGYAEISELRIYCLDEPELVGPEHPGEYQFTPVPSGGMIDPSQNPILDPSGQPILPP